MEKEQLVSKYEENESVTILPFTEDGKIVLIHKLVPCGKYIWDFPTGKFRSNDKPDRCVVETLEESGIKLEKIITKYKSGYQNTDSADRKAQIIICKVSIINGKSDNNTNLPQPHIFTYSEAFGLMTDDKYEMSGSCQFLILGMHIIPAIDLLLKF